MPSNDWEDRTPIGSFGRATPSGERAIFSTHPYCLPRLRSAVWAFGRQSTCFSGASNYYGLCCSIKSPDLFRLFSVRGLAYVAARQDFSSSQRRRVVKPKYLSQGAPSCIAGNNFFRLPAVFSEANHRPIREGVLRRVQSPSGGGASHRFGQAQLAHNIISTIRCEVAVVPDQEVGLRL